MKYSTHAKRQLEKEDQELVIRTIKGLLRQKEDLLTALNAVEKDIKRLDAGDVEHARTVLRLRGSGVYQNS